MNTSAQPDALVLFNPALNTAGLSQNRPHQFDADALGLSPMQQLKDQSVPTVIFHGTADTTVPHIVAEEYCEKLNGLYGSCTLHSYDGASHGFFNRRVQGGRWYRPTVKAMDSFLSELGYLEPM